MAAGVDISVISNVLGHSSIAITNDTYGHLLAGVGKDASEKANTLVPRSKIKSRRDQSVTSTAKTAVDRDASTAVSPGQASGPEVPHANDTATTSGHPLPLRTSRSMAGRGAP